MVTNQRREGNDPFHPNAKIPAEGAVFGSWTVSGPPERRRYPSGQTRVMVPVTCGCGGTAIVQAALLRSGRSTSCRPCADMRTTKYLTSDGRVASNVAVEHGITRAGFFFRMSRGWTADDAATTPPHGPTPAYVKRRGETP